MYSVFVLKWIKVNKATEYWFWQKNEYSTHLFSTLSHSHSPVSSKNIHEGGLASTRRPHNPDELSAAKLPWQTLQECLVTCTYQIHISLGHCAHPVYFSFTVHTEILNLNVWTHSECVLHSLCEEITFNYKDIFRLNRLSMKHLWNKLFPVIAPCLSFLEQITTQFMFRNACTCGCPLHLRPQYTNKVHI